ncbi:MAG TPA: trypsin-like peptidase domain-containing protein [Bryobacteraceae bacterium]|nr:trypsin-like peptidase domain-containing protein [Bryobacteraceae bacterium]
MSLFDKIRSQKLLSLSLLLFTLSIGVLIGTLVTTGVKAAKDQVTAPGASPLAIPNPVQLSTAFTRLAKQLEPSVVNISSTYVQKAPAQTKNRRRQQQQPDEEDQDDNGMQDFFERFFGNPFGGTPQLGPRKSYSLGSGVVVDKAGYILTNDHVVEKATRVQVKFNGDPEQYDAKVIGTDSATDVAVLKVDRPNLVPAKIGNSDGVEVGDWAVAIGSPFGFQATVTAGIISAKSRDIPGENIMNSGFQHFLQTDAAINPGNSGGPLLNINGEVIGINTMIASRSGGYQGIGFALPINTAVKIYNQIIKTGKVTRGSIGVSFNADDDKNREFVKAYGGTQGIFINRVEPGGPAEKGGLQAGDIIIALEGKTVTRGQDLMDRVADSAVGETMKITVLRNGKKEELSVVIGDRNKVFASQFGGPRNEEAEPGEGTPAKFGISIQNLNNALRENLGYKGPAGVLVASVEPGSFADEIGLQQNDIITNINRQPVTSADELIRLQNTLKPGDSVAFRVMRAAGRNQAWEPAFVVGRLSSGAQQ